MVSAGSKQAKGFAVQISLLLESIPNLELGESMEFPASKILTAKTVHRYISINDKVGGEETADAPPVKKAPKKPDVSKKRPAAAAEEQVLKKKRTIKKKSVTSHSTLEMVAVAQEAVPIQMVEASAGVPTAEQPAAEDNIPANQTVDEDAETFAADDVDHIIQQVLSKAAQSASTEGEQIEELDIRDLIAKWDAEKEVTTPSDTDEEIEAGRASEPIDRVQTEVSQPAYLVEKSADMERSTADQSVDEFIDADEARSLEDIILSIPADVPLPSADVEITKIIFGKEIKIPGVDEKACYLATLPQIPVDEKGKEILVEIDHVKGNPAQEHFSLTCADIDLLVNLRAQVIYDVDQFFNSFSFKKLATMNLEGISAKGEQVLLWGETDNIHVALARKKYILLKYRAVLVRKFLDGWIINFVPGEGDSAVHLKVIDMLSARLSFVLDDLKQQALANGIRWDRPCCSILFDNRLPDQRTTPAYAILEVSSQRQYDDTLPLMNEFFRLMKKRWADVCLEVVGFCNSRRLLQVGSLQFCRSLSVVELVFRVAPRQSPVSALRVSQFCSVFIDFSLFSWLPTVDITDFLSSIALDRTIVRDVQIAQNIVSVAPSVQMLDEPSYSDSSSDDILIDFDDQDTTAALNQLRASIDQILIARLEAQDRALGALRKASNDQRNLLSLELQSSHKQLGAQIVTTGLDVVDVRRVVKETHQELNAKINSLDEQVAATINDLLEFSAQAQQTLSIITSQLSEIVAYINRGGENKNGESSSSHRPLPTPVH
ncbi:hypothetical protein F511_33499 [Dorcoceras hygrometricum]|uniref:Uncharacterized protein n=1 Tax=Dorcoceras hygrometricum TaxID=472368 RepID=A0A2Z7CEN5_9LAMI|nr:hypothetical protein F511_33499 [Dorcoceras hygrometricum]